MTAHWTPTVGDLVWINQPDLDEPEGRVVGFVPDDARSRKGQPVIERLADDVGPFTDTRKGDRVVIHPSFLLPFPFGGPEWRQAEREGRIG